MSLCRLVTDFIDKVLRENASRASARDPPLSYREAKERWQDVLEKRAGYGARPGAAQGRDGAATQQRGGQGAGGRTRAGTQLKGREAKTAAGEPVCYHFNRKSGCSRQKKGTGCEGVRGGVFAHVCNFDTGNGKYCLAAHSRAGAH